MARQRPTIVTVMAIINLILGSLFALIYCCAGIGILFLFSLLSGSGPSAPGMPDLGGLFKAIDQAMPSYKYVLIVSTLITLFTTAILFISGIGLLQMRRYGRTLSLAYGGITIVMTLASLVYTLGYANPAIETVTQNWAAQEQAKIKGGGTFTPPPQQNSPVSGVIGPAIMVIYSLVLLIVMLQSNVKRAFDPSAPDGSGPDSNRLDIEGIDRGYHDRFPRENLPPDDRYT